MLRHPAVILLVFGVLQAYASAQFNILPVSVAESVIEEHKQKERTNELHRAQTTEEPLVVPLHPKVVAGLRQEDKNVVDTSGPSEDVKPQAAVGGRVKREDTFTRTRVSGVDRSASRHADIDSFLSELEGDIAKTQPKRYNVAGVDSSPSWSYKPQAPATQRPFWKKWGDSISSTYTQVKNKAKDISKGLQA